MTAPQTEPEAFAERTRAWRQHVAERNARAARLAADLTHQPRKALLAFEHDLHPNTCRVLRRGSDGGWAVVGDLRGPYRRRGGDVICDHRGSDRRGGDGQRLKGQWFARFAVEVSATPKMARALASAVAGDKPDICLLISWKRGGRLTRVRSDRATVQPTARPNRVILDLGTLVEGW